MASFSTRKNLKILYSCQKRVTTIKASLSDQKVNLYSKSQQQSYLVNLTWNDQINITKSNYNILRIRKTFKRFTPWNVRKSLAESLILCRINYCIAVHSQIPKYLQNRLQRLQNSAVGHVFGKCANTLAVINLIWLHVAENREFSISKLAYQDYITKTGLNICQLN